MTNVPPPPPGPDNSRASEPGYTPPPYPQDQPQQSTPPEGQYYPPQGFAPAPMLESEARTMSMLTHLLAILVGIVSPLIFWLIYKDRSALVDYHGKEQLNFQISVLIYSFALSLFIIITGGFGAILALPAVMALWVYVIVILIVAGMAANRGEYYRIPLTIRFIS